VKKVSFNRVPTWKKETFFGALALLCVIVGCNQPISPTGKPRGPQWVIYHPSNSPLLSDSINAVIIANNTKWIATQNGANSFNGVSWQTLTDPLSYDTPIGKSAKINTITVGKDLNVWFGLAGGGIVKLNLYLSTGDRWKHYGTPDLNSDFVYALTTDNLGDIYAATSVGVSRFIPTLSDPNGGRWLKYGPGNSPIPDEPIRSAGFNAFDNLVWFGTSSQGVVSFDGDQYWNTDMPSDAPFPILSMAFSRFNAIWFGTYADWAYQYSTTTFEWTHIADSATGGGLKDNFVNAVAVEINGTVWFGSNKGLTKYTGTSWKTFTRENSSLPSDTITSLALDIKGNLWIGTHNGIAEHNEEGTVP
jgi:ligand-binding sensor domain-containing protein